MGRWIVLTVLVMVLVGIVAVHDVMQSILI